MVGKFWAMEPIEVVPNTMFPKVAQIDTKNLLSDIARPLKFKVFSRPKLLKKPE